MNYNSRYAIKPNQTENARTEDEVDYQMSIIEFNRSISAEVYR